MTRSVSALLQALAEEFVALHATKEDLFWESAMGQSDHPKDVARALSEAEKALNRFRQNPATLDALRDCVNAAGNQEEHEDVQGWINFFGVHVIMDPGGRRLSEEIVERETALVEACQKFRSGFIDPETDAFVPMVPNNLLAQSKFDPDESHRRAAYEGLLAIERAVLENGLLDIVRLRNRLGRMLGYEDFYDMRTSRIERMRKHEVFAVLDRLAVEAAPRMHAEVARLAKEGRERSNEPWNFEFYTQGQVMADLDPYHPMASAVERWVRGFQGLGVEYEGASLTFDLIDRPGKYPNGYMHAPGIAYRKRSVPQPARVNVLVNGNPEQIGGGYYVAKTLAHEAGHAAHLSRVHARIPCLATEYPPESTSHLEAQSFIFESTVMDAAWRSRYARDRAGNPMPEELIMNVMREEKRTRAIRILGLLTIAMGERRLYETPDDELVPERVLAKAREVEIGIQGLSGGTRPLFSVHHLRSGESSATYHGYPLALTGMTQMRDFFRKRDGHVTDNHRAGPELARHCWEQGSAATFGDTVHSLTGDPLSPDAFIAEFTESEDAVIAKARAEMEIVSRLPEIRIEDVDLNANIRLTHGRETIATNEHGYARLCEDYSRWIESLETPTTS